jgi:WD40 repeat protein
MRYPATAADISPDGRWLAVANENFEILLWDLHTGQRVGNSWEPPSATPIVLKFTPDSQRLYSVDKYGDLIEWEIQTGNILNLRVLPFPDTTQSIAFNADASLLAMTTSLPPAVHVFDVASGEPIGESLKTKAGFPYALTFSPDSRLLVVEDLLSQTGATEIWNLESRELLKTLKQPQSVAQSDLFPAVFSPDGSKLANAYIGQILIWDWAAETFVQVEPSGDLEFVGGFTPLYFSRDASKLYFRAFDNTLIAADPTTGKTLPEVLTGLTAEVFYLLMTPDESQVIGIDSKGQIVIWRMDGRQILRDTLPLPSELPFHAALSPDAAHIAYIDSDNMVRILSSVDGQVILEVETPHTATIDSAAYSPNGRWLATGDVDGKIILWDIQTGTVVRTWTEHEDDVRYLQFTPDSQKLFASGTDKAQKLLFDVATGAVLANLEIPNVPVDQQNIQHSVTSADFSPDGRLLAVATAIGRLQLYDMTTFEPLRSTQITAVSFALTFNPDGTLLAAQGDNKTILLLDVETLEPIRRPLVGHIGLPVGIAFSPDGTLLASADTHLYVWDVATAQLLGSPLPLHSDNSNIRGQKTHFMEDGTSLTVLAKNGVTRWNLDFAAISELTCQQANLNLTLAEWERFFPGEPYRPTCPNSSFYLIEFTQYAVALEDKTAAAELFQVIGDWARHVSDDNALLIVCQYGALYGFAESVLPACDNLVGRDAIWHYRLTRSYARAMSGDLAGAIEDVEASLDWLRQLSDWQKQLGFAGRDANIEEREKWLETLKSGENPYADETTLATLRERLELIAALPEEEEPDEEQSIFGLVLDWDQFQQLPFDAMFIGSMPGGAFSFTKIEDMSDDENRFGLLKQWTQVGVNGDIAVTYTVGFAEQGATLLVVLSPAPAGGDVIAWVNDGGFDAELLTLENGTQAALAENFAAVIQDDLLITFITPNREDGNPINNLPEVVQAALTNTFLYSEYAVITTLYDVQAKADKGNTAEAEQALMELLPQLENEDNPVLHNQACWIGSLSGFAETVLPNCDKAVDLATPSEMPFYQDSRGVARALTGDTAGAIEDFTAFVAAFADNEKYAEMVVLRQDILAALQAGENPFDEALLDQLRNEGG